MSGAVCAFLFSAASFLGMTDNSRKGMGRNKANLLSVAQGLLDSYLETSADSALASLRGWVSRICAHSGQGVAHTFPTPSSFHSCLLLCFRSLRCSEVMAAAQQLGLVTRAADAAAAFAAKA